MRSTSFYASELRRAREVAGLTQEQLAQQMNFSQGYVAHIENGGKSPSPDFTARADEVLKTDGMLSRIRDHHLKQAVTPEWLEHWYQAEGEATHIWWFELSLVPGLLQTEAYARAVLRGDEAKIAARLARQETLNRGNPPAYVAIMDERALRYPVGDNEIMREQLGHLDEMAERFVIQVVPGHCGTYLHLDGSFGLAAVDGREHIYVDTPARGFMLSNPDVVLRMRERWDLIRAEALSRQQTVEHIREEARQWT